MCCRPTLLGEQTNNTAKIRPAICVVGLLCWESKLINKSCIACYMPTLLGEQSNITAKIKLALLAYSVTYNFVCKYEHSFHGAF